MKNGWVKLHKQTVYNKVWRNDHTAWHVFEALMMIADIKTGSWEGGRFQLSDLCGLNANTTYKALLRLKRLNMVTLSSNNKYSTIHICKWGNFQSPSNTSDTTKGNNKVTTKEQQSNTLIRTKELRTKEVVPKGTTISSLYYQVIKALDLPVRNHNSLKSKIKELEASDNHESIIKYLEFMRDMFKRATWDYKPSVVEGLDIYNKRKQIEESIRRVQNKSKKGIKV